jgi:hypothetical protein
MEARKYFKTKATLELVGFNDISGRDGKLLEHRMFFVADESSKNLKETWTINDTSSYERMMLHTAIRKRLLYRLSEIHTEVNFHFWLIVRKAEEFDCFYRRNLPKLHTTYYIMDAGNTITGPLYISEFDDPVHLQKLLDDGQLYVPTRKQLYEECKKQQSA